MKVKLVMEAGPNSLLHTSYESKYAIRHGQKAILGSKTNQVCRFCNRTKNQTRFKNKAHVLPEFMGNKSIFSNYECDECNEYFGELETSLSNFAGILNVFSMVKGKRGYSKYKGNKEGFELFVENEHQLIAVTDDLESEEVYIMDKENKKIHVNTNQHSYVPHDAFKAIVKIALCMLNEVDFSKYSKAVDWLMKPNNEDNIGNPLFNIYRKFGKNRFKLPWGLLMQKKNISSSSNMPNHTFILFYGMIQYQIFLPFHEDDVNLFKNDTIVLPLEERLQNEKTENGIIKEIWVDKIDMSGIEKLKDEMHRFSIPYYSDKKI